MKFLRKFAALGLIAAFALTSIPPAAFAQNAGYPTFNFKNLLHNPRLDIYPAGTTEVYTSSTLSATLTGINTTPKYNAGRWAVWSNAGGASVTVANVTTGLPAGFANGEVVQRASTNTNTTQICMGQEMRTADVLALAGQPVVFSAFVGAGANFSAVGSNATLLIGTGTGTDEGLVTFLSGFAGAATPMSVNLPVTTVMSRIAATAVIPATATELVAAVCWTPVGTAGTADTLTITGLQLEQGTALTTLENRQQTVESTLVSAYTQVFTDGAATRRYGMCQGTVSNTTAACFLSLTVPMRAAPTVTVGTSASFGTTVAAGTAQVCSALAAIATSSTIDSIALNCTAASVAVGGAMQFIGAATGGLVLASADF